MVRARFSSTNLNRVGLHLLKRPSKAPASFLFLDLFLVSIFSSHFLCDFSFKREDCRTRVGKVLGRACDELFEKSAVEDAWKVRVCCGLVKPREVALPRDVLFIHTRPRIHPRPCRLTITQLHDPATLTLTLVL